MKILGLIQKDSGPGFHRVMMPLVEMHGEDTKVTNNCTEADIDWCDAIYYNREINPDLVKSAKEAGKKVIVDVDDYWVLDRHHISYRQYLATRFERKQIQHIEQADLITTTHERLQAKIKPYNERCIITPNAIPINNYFAIERTESAIPRIFWQGSITHEKDIELLRNPFKRLTGCATVIAGYNKCETWDRMVSSFTCGLRHKGAVLSGVSPMEYYSNYAYADICVAPLVSSPFNAMKSNLKVLEAAHSSLPIVCSKVDPYLDLPVLYAEKQGDWYKHLNKLVRDSEHRAKCGSVIKEYCDEVYNFEKINNYRMNEFKKIIYGNT